MTLGGWVGGYPIYISVSSNKKLHANADASNVS